VAVGHDVWVRPAPGGQRSPPIDVNREGSQPWRNRSRGFRGHGGRSRSGQGRSGGSLKDVVTVRCEAAVSSPTGGSPSAALSAAPVIEDAERGAVRCGGQPWSDAACTSGDLHGGGRGHTTTSSSSQRCVGWHLTMIGRGGRRWGAESCKNVDGRGGRTTGYCGGAVSLYSLRRSRS
jgi:hypothetical protein